MKINKRTNYDFDLTVEEKDSIETTIEIIEDIYRTLFEKQTIVVTADDEANELLEDDVEICLKVLQRVLEDEIYLTDTEEM